MRYTPGLILIAWKICSWLRIRHASLAGMKDARVDEIRRLSPQVMLPDWMRLGGRMVRLLRDQHHPQAHEKPLKGIH